MMHDYIGQPIHFSQISELPVNYDTPQQVHAKITETPAGCCCEHCPVKAVCSHKRGW